MTEREKSEIFNRALGTVILWLGFLLLAVVLIGGAIHGMTLWQLVSRVTSCGAVALLGAGMLNA